MQHAHAFPQSRRAIARIAGMPALLLMVLAAILIGAPRMLPAAISPIDALSAPPTGPAPTLDGPAERAQDNFPGSAYFFAEGAFDPAPQIAQSNDPHVYAIDPGAAASTYVFRAASAGDSLRALNCLTQAIYYEAGNEPEEGQRAVAQVVLNRVRHPAWPGSVCGVVYQDSQRSDMRCQFTFTCDGALLRRPSIAGWARASRIAAQALAGSTYAPAGLATHYHTLAVSPFWSSSLKVVGVIGAHIFYRLPADGPSALRAGYSGREIQPPPYIPRPATNPLLPAAPYPFAGAGGTMASPQPATPYLPQGMLPPAPANLPGTGTKSWSDGLPESTIKPEYRNSGRPLI